MSIRWRPIATNLLVLLASLGLFFGLAEMALRLSGKISSNALRSPDLGTLDRIPGLFEPGQEFVDRILPELPFPVRTNALGFRGPEIRRERPDGTLRILCVGDSYTFGPYVPDDETLPARLERVLSQGATRRVEVVNGGVNGFTIADESRFLKERALEIDPGLVILFFSQNDIQDLHRPRLMIDLMRDHAALKSRFLIGPALRILQHTAVFNFMQRAAARLRGRPQAPPAGGAPAAGPAAGPRPDAWQRYSGILAELTQEMRRREIPLLLVAWPSARQIAGEDSLDPQARLAAIAAEVDVPFHDLTPAIADLAARGERAFLVPIDGHPTGRAYQAGAEAVARALRELGILAQGGRPPG